MNQDGIYYLQTIHMVNDTNSDTLTHQSRWATLAFEVSHKHKNNTHTHDNHAHEDGTPIWVFILDSLLVVGFLFLIFKKKN